MATPPRKRVDSATLHLSDGTAVKVTVGESEDGRPPLLRMSVVGRTPRVTGLWTGGAAEQYVEVELVP